MQNQTPVNAKPIFPWTEEREMSHQSDVAYLRSLEEQRRDLNAEIQKYQERIEVDGSMRSEAFFARQRQRERDAVLEAQRTGKNVVYKDPEDGCEVTATVGGHTFYNAADWY